MMPREQVGQLQLMDADEASCGLWRVSNRADPQVVPMADRHYNRQKVGSAQFVPPGRCHVLKAGTPEQLATPDTGGAFWVTSWPFAEYVKHEWAGAWVCSAFRNEGAAVSSELIRSAVAATNKKWADIPELGMISFIDPSKVMPRKVRSRDTWGHSWFVAGFNHVGYTKAGLWVFQMLPDRIQEISLQHIADCTRCG
jgi:hypothetical protein